jgi:hypothetical protein
MVSKKSQKYFAKGQELMYLLDPFVPIIFGCSEKHSECDEIFQLLFPIPHLWFEFFKGFVLERL